MAKNKLQKFADNEIFSNVFQPTAQSMYEGDFELKGKWNINFFNNQKCPTDS